MTMNYAGVDDGYSAIKAAWLDPMTGSVRTLRFPSRAKNTEAVDLSGKVSPDMYETENHRMWVTSHSDASVTRFNDYPFSPLNRILIHHALRKANLGGSEVVLATALPAGEYFTHEKSRGRKRASLEVPVQGLDGEPTAVISRHVVAAQGLAGLFDWMLDENGRTVNNVEERAAIVDIGGRTTDVVGLATDSDNRPVVDLEITGSINRGVMDIEDYVRRMLVDRFDLDADELSDVTKLIDRRTFKHNGIDQDISDIVDNGIKQVGEEVLRFAQSKIGKGRRFDPVLFIGGGAEVFKPVVEKYPNAIILPDPAFANSRGLLKAAMFLPS